MLSLLTIYRNEYTLKSVVGILGTLIACFYHQKVNFYKQVNVFVRLMRIKGKIWHTGSQVDGCTRQ